MRGNCEQSHFFSFRFHRSATQKRARAEQILPFQEVDDSLSSLSLLPLFSLRGVAICDTFELRVVNRAQIIKRKRQARMLIVDLTLWRVCNVCRR